MTLRGDAWGTTCTGTATVGGGGERERCTTTGGGARGRLSKNGQTCISTTPSYH